LNVIRITLDSVGRHAVNPVATLSAGQYGAADRGFGCAARGREARHLRQVVFGSGGSGVFPTLEPGVSPMDRCARMR